MLHLNPDIPAMAPFQYPHNYDHLGKAITDNIIRWFTNKQITADNLSSHGSWSMAQDVRQQMRDKTWELAERGIYVGYDQVGHRGEWFLITQFDAAVAQDIL